MPPKKGYFSLSCHVRNETAVIAEIYEKKQFMFSYSGHNFENKCDILQFHSDLLAEGYLELKALDGAKLEPEDEIYMSEANPTFLTLKNTLKRDLEISFDPIAQYLIPHKDSNRVCFAACLWHSFKLLTGRSLDIFEVMEKLYDHHHHIYGNWSLGSMAFHALSSREYSLRIHRYYSLELIEQQLVMNKPVIVSIQGEIEGAIKPFLDGHLLTVVGLDEKSVIVLDSASNTRVEVLKRYPMPSFLKAWERRNYTAFTFEKKI